MKYISGEWLVHKEFLSEVWFGSMLYCGREPRGQGGA